MEKLELERKYGVRSGGKLGAFPYNDSSNYSTDSSNRRSSHLSTGNGRDDETDFAEERMGSSDVSDLSLKENESSDLMESIKSRNKDGERMSGARNDNDFTYCRTTNRDHEGKSSKVASSSSSSSSSSEGLLLKMSGFRKRGGWRKRILEESDSE